MHLRFSRKKIILSCLLVFLFSWGCGEPKGGDSAPAFSLQEITGETVSLDQYKGRIVLLDFWATWCPPCRKSIPELVALQDKYKEQGLVVLGISMDDPSKVSDSDLAAFKKHFKINYKILKASTDVLKDYFGTGNISIPTMFFINREGKIVDKHVGFMPGAVEASLKKMLS
ncbi:MAG: TlpA family protein disulfide reductase [Deltaproteobacteria bacterium]|nr:TlpA family protein disulfide reductase [Deltaproteobacteria bacterium]